MAKFRRIILWAVLVLIILLIFLSIYGAFIGPQQAKDLFNSIPLIIYWFVFTLVLIAGLITFGRLAQRPKLLLIHTGCILVLTGGMIGSESAHNIRKRLFGLDTIPAGQIALYKGQVGNRVILDSSEQVRELPFSVKLKDFRIQYYEPQYLRIQSRDGLSWKMPVEVGKEFSLGPNLGTVEILRVFENFKITTEDDKRIAVDSTQPGYNPALQVQTKGPDGSTETRYVFELFPEHAGPEDKLLLSYYRVISDYISDLQIIKDGKIVVDKSIEVNKPLHFGGYHFYQHSYDSEAGRYSVLKVVSDTGLNAVYTGYILLCIGVFWHFWLRDTFKKH